LILPITIRRQPDDTFHVSWPAPIEVPSSDPLDLQRATQAVADALASTIAAAPDQWYSFKPIWPSTAEEAADLARRASLMQGNNPDPGPAREFG
jgi:lauroyl/myristoyl acyltransferase